MGKTPTTPKKIKDKTTVPPEGAIVFGELSILGLHFGEFDSPFGILGYLYQGQMSDGHGMNLKAIINPSIGQCNI